MRKYRFSIGVFLLLLLFNGTVLANSNTDDLTPSKEQIAFINLPDNWNYDSLIPILENGEMNIVYSNKDGSFKQTTIICLVDAPIAKVWPNVVDFENYTKYMPKLAALKLLKQDGFDYWFKGELDIPGPNLPFSIKAHFNPPSSVDFYGEELEGDCFPGGWRFDAYPVDNGKKTVIVCKAYIDVRKRSWIVRWTLNYDPTLGQPLNLGINSSVGTMWLTAIKKRSEAKK